VFVEHYVMGGKWSVPSDSTVTVRTPIGASTPTLSAMATPTPKKTKKKKKKPPHCGSDCQ